MTTIPEGIKQHLEERLQSLPFTRRVRIFAERLGRRLMRKPRTVTESPNLLPLLIQVLAAFSKANGEVLEEEIDSSLGFLRYDYPGGGLFGAAQALPPGAERTAGPQRDGAEARRGAEHGAQGDARRAALRSDLQGGHGAAAGRHLLLAS